MQVITVNSQYSSAARRLAAFFIDHLVASIVLGMFFWQMWDWPVLSFRFMSHNFLQATLIIIYYALMESSRYQATFGKIVMGIKVTGNHGERLDFSKALLRNLSKLISGLIFCIGYIMIIFDDRKQGLHDKIADTFVVKQ
jgi:uncharacterized RDD family membrane protein YckC